MEVTNQITKLIRELKLLPMEELRLEVNFDQSLSFQLVKGTAEIFGSELAAKRVYKFSGTKLAVFTWHGAVVSIEGKCLIEYISNESTNLSYYNTHLALEQLRREKESSLEPQAGPRTLVLGSSRNTVAKILMNYDVRHERTPIYVDADVLNGQLLFPGTVACCKMDRVFDPEEGLPLANPLAYFYGHTTLLNNLSLYKKIIKAVAENIELKMSNDNAVKKSGTYIVFPDWSDQFGFDLLNTFIEAFNINMILVVGNERLHSELIKKVNFEGTILKLPVSGGVVRVDPAFRMKRQMSRIRTYFYGSQGEFCPHTLVLNFKDVKIRKFEKGLLAPTSALPIGASRKVEEIKIVAVEPSSIMVNSILGVYSTDLDSEPDNSIIPSVMGFVFVSDVDESKGRLTILNPCPGRLAYINLVCGTLKWLENQ